MNNKSIEIIKKSFNEKKNSHAFLMETNNINLCLNDIINLILDINNISREINIDNFSDIKILHPEGKDIKKQQITKIIEEFQTFPVELKHRYYVILSSEFMNQSSANVILKFLEEPDNSIIGFFITNNRSANINTIVSRCQSYKIIYHKENEFDTEKIDLFLSKMSYDQFYQRLLFLNSFINKDRIDNINLFKEIKLYLLSNKDFDIHAAKRLVKRITLLDNVIERLMKNGNQDLIILDIARNWK